ncbi:hypothetical protein Tco_0665439 [Tanacetum coccineum]
MFTSTEFDVIAALELGAGTGCLDIVVADATVLQVKDYYENEQYATDAASEGRLLKRGILGCHNLGKLTPVSSSFSSTEGSRYDSAASRHSNFSSFFLCPLTTLVMGQDGLGGTTSAQAQAAQ